MFGEGGSTDSSPGCDIDQLGKCYNPSVLHFPRMVEVRFK